MDFKDYYATLGVERGSSQEEIQRAYRKLARKHHPDVNKSPGAEDKFKDISEAYEVLKDPEKRSKYDQFGQAWKQSQHTGGPPPGFEQFVDFGQGGFDFDPGSGFSSFFEALFGQGARGGGADFRTGGPSGGSWMRRGPDHEASISLTLKEAAHGGQREINLSSGGGSSPRTYMVRIPSGVRPGQKIRLAGQGGPGSGGGPPGDLYLTVSLRVDSSLRLEGSDVHTTIAVAPWEAALGGQADVETLDGPVTVRIPKGSSSGRKIRLRGRGFPRSSGGSGDLYAEIRIEVPEKLSAKEKELYEELRKSSSFRPREKM